MIKPELRLTAYENVALTRALSSTGTFGVQVPDQKCEHIRDVDTKDAIVSCGTRIESLAKIRKDWTFEEIGALGSIIRKLMTIEIENIEKK